ncbi:MAG: ribosome assembly cofactor RimP [Brevibacterium sp.]|uniref:ribosome maturation factor RimP n=1 Tax=Brevibacterium sp. TaxID=1701 RepID=UPI0026472388|nr:ribosome assembly cofactor RimP [Brevibacterium sp.]MDN5807206.1 ribosome assembly cofactor RimP [Brevibacterium sp.]MDN5833510.1 ribosome assembly cofactor RimP [Brevibacterium sp.]MDN5877327.1 ribosome assembly cofactor RimP [Brevibacterium sp.]MDN5909044.1 ribosome assembly cofactor RimP [Brevibacterium sp.]MDN6134951.1 ribosome assembly cofactor RimP [Brevibacterium sp.]
MDEDVAQIEELLREPLETSGFYLESVKAVAAGQRRALTVVVDLDESSTDAMSMDKIAESSRLVGDTLDEIEIFRDKPYQLEVTSPGATRKLERPRHFKRVLGRRLEINTKKDSFKLDLDDVGENSISGIDPASREKRTVSLSDIVKAQVELKFR